MDELKCRKRVLRRLGYANASDAIELKGRVACEISAADELLLTELLFNGVFNDLEVAQVNLIYIFANQSECQDITNTHKGITLVIKLKTGRFCLTDSLYIGAMAVGVIGPADSPIGSFSELSSLFIVILGVIVNLLNVFSKLEVKNCQPNTSIPL